MYPNPNAQAVACPWHLCLRREPELCSAETASQAGRPCALQLTGGSPQSVYRVRHASWTAAKGNHTQSVLPWFFGLRPALGNVAGRKTALEAWKLWPLAQTGYTRFHLPFTHSFTYCDIVDSPQYPHIASLPSVLARVPSILEDSASPS